MTVTNSVITVDKLHSRLTGELLKGWTCSKGLVQTEKDSHEAYYEQYGSALTMTYSLTEDGWRVMVEAEEVGASAPYIKLELSPPLPLTSITAIVKATLQSA